KLQEDLLRVRGNLQTSIKNGKEANAQECRRILTILAWEIIPLKHAIKDAGGTPFDRLEEPLKPGDYIQTTHGRAYVEKVNRTTITTYSYTGHGNTKWILKHKKSDFIQRIATAEELEENRKEQGEK